MTEKLLQDGYETETFAEPEETEAVENENTDGQYKKQSCDDGISIMLESGERRLTREEAEKYARMGLEREYEDPIMVKLDYLAASEGVSREEYIDRQLKLGEERILKELVERYGDDEETIYEMLEYEREKNKRLYDELLSKRKAEENSKNENVHSRLAEEYAELVNEFPELEGKGFAELPLEVKKAGFEGERLLNAYLRYRHSEEKKIKSELAYKTAADESSAGSMQTAPYDGKGEAERHYLNALWQK